MRALKSLLALLTARWFLTLIGAVLLALLVWYFGPLVSIAGRTPLADERTRLLLVLAISVIWGAGNLLAQRRAAAADNRLIEAIAAPEPRAGPADAELAELERRFRDAVQALKHRRFPHRLGHGFLYELPWYLMIGPPGAGKTTAILQSGLRFPLEGRQGHELKGVGGTRNCDWFFTDEAVLLDTAGRWTTQESDRAADEAAWLGFLDLLRRYRPRQPVNGVLVAISVSDLLGADPGEIEAMADAVRQRLAELSERLGLRLPAYLLLTKADLLAGFNEFFGGLDEREREQVWGFTLPSAEQALTPERLHEELSALLGRLSGQVTGRLEAVRDLEQRALILSLPTQMAALEAPLARLVDRAFRHSTYETPPLLRGVYLTSGTQEGTPIDRLLGALVQDFGLRLAPPPTSRGNRSFFLIRLLREVVFAEAPLVRRASRLDRRERRLAAAAWTAAATLLLLGAGLLGWSYLARIGELQAFATSLDRYARTTQPLAVAGLEDPAAVVPALDQARALASPPAGGPPGLGLSLDRRLAAEGDAVYRRALAGLLLPRLLRQTEIALRRDLAAPERVREALPVYLALGGQADLARERPQVESWLAAEWQRRYPLDDTLRARLGVHLGILLDRLPELDPPSLDGGLVRQAVAAIDRVPLALRAYDKLARRLADEGAPWRPLDHAGPEAQALFAETRGGPLGTPIPALFTRAGFYERFLPQLVGGARAEAQEHARLHPNRPPPGEAELARLVREMLDLYYKDYIDRWQQLEQGLTIRLPGSLAEAGSVLRPLAIPPSPLSRLLGAMLEETRLTQLPPLPADAGAAASAARQATELAAAAVNAVLARTGPAAPKLGEPVERQFRHLAALLDATGGASPLDRALAAANELYTGLPAPGAPLAPGQGAEIRARAAALKEAAQPLPSALKEQIEAVGARVTAVTSGQVLARINDEWRAKVLPFCRQAIAQRFPFERTSATDASLADIGRLFAAGGMIDQFIDQQLAPLIDTARRPWRWQQPIGSTDAALAPFETARRLRDGLFAGGAAPKAGFTLKPLELDPGAARVLLDLDGQTLSYAHGPVQPVHLDWPAPAGSRVARLTFMPVGGGAPTILAREGPWAWFRLLHEAQLERTGRPELYRVAFAAGARRARFELLADSVDNPFDLSLFARFRCPGGL
jgi:type VI secretion system protein ImpL